MKKLFSVFLLLLLIVFNGCISKDESVVVSKDGNYMFYENSNSDIQKNSYEEMSVLDSADDKNVNTEHLHLLNFHWLHNSYGKLFSIVKKDGKYGIVNEKNDFLINPDYESISNIYNGFFIIKKDNKYGYLNEKFKIVQEPVFLDAKEFSNKIAFVKFPNEKWGCISTKMKVQLEGKFDGIFPFINSYARVINDDKWGFINQKCEVVVEPKYDFVNNFYSDFTKVILDKKVGYIGKDGKEIVNPIFTSGQNFNE